MEHNILRDVLVLLTVSVVAISLFRRLRVPSIISYLLVGIIAGPYALAWISHSETTRLLGEIGVVFLLFTIGLDFSLAQFSAMKKTLLGLGGAQVLVGTISGGIIAWSLGVSWQGAIIVGGALALSSTAIVIKQLTDQLELQTEHGRLSFSILMFQDLAAVPFLALIPILGQGEALTWSLLGITLLKGIIALVSILLLGHYALRSILHEVAASRSAELFTLTVLLISLAAAWLTHSMGLSLALGAFLAGMLISETEYRHQIEVEIRPFRDVLMGLFFITVGMQLDLLQLTETWPKVILLLIGLIAGKGFVIYLLLRLAGYSSISALRTGQILAQAGEFSIALLVLAVLFDLISLQDSQPILAAIILSMIFAPLLIKFNARITEIFIGNSLLVSDENIPNDISEATHEIKDHVIICGYGKVGQTIAESLRSQDITFIALDIDPHIIKPAWREEEPVFYGNALNSQILLAAGIERAKAIVICVNEEVAALKILHAARHISSDILILLRARDETSLNKFIDAGADEIVTETMETGTMLITQLLLLLKKSPEEVYDEIKIIRSKRYPLLKSIYDEKKKI